ncbi:unnamed protein product [Closterium sp. NIES-65]|nr:unnamed protein product [Closterium sp. NIES-65]
MLPRSKSEAGRGGVALRRGRARAGAVTIGSVGSEAELAQGVVRRASQGELAAEEGGDQVNVVAQRARATGAKERRRQPSEDSASSTSGSRGSSGSSVGGMSMIHSQAQQQQQAQQTQQEQQPQEQQMQQKTKQAKQHRRRKSGGDVTAAAAAAGGSQAGLPAGGEGIAGGGGYAEHANGGNGAGGSDGGSQGVAFSGGGFSGGGHLGGNGWGRGGVEGGPAALYASLLAVHPPLISKSGRQVVRCQWCSQMLAVPAQLQPSHKGRQKLRCGKCMRVSKYAVTLPPPDMPGLPLLIPVESAQEKGDVQSQDAQQQQQQQQQQQGLAAQQSLPRRASQGAAGEAQPSAKHVRKSSGGSDSSTSGVAPALRMPSTGAAAAAAGAEGAGGVMAAAAVADENGQELVPRTASGKRFQRQARDMLATRRVTVGPGGKLATVPSFRAAPQIQGGTAGGGAAGGGAAGGGAAGDGAGGGGGEMSLRRTSTERKGAKGVEGGGAVVLMPRSRTMSMGVEAQYRRKVVVNGVPVPDQRVLVAEQRIGKIEPGNYWYDCRAGFWGPVGSASLGVIPAFMRELGNAPVSMDCSGGKSKILVNGRELHRKDVKVLAEKGFPETLGGRYTLDADGTLVNEFGRVAANLGSL